MAQDMQKAIEENSAATHHDSFTKPELKFSYYRITPCLLVFSHNLTNVPQYLLRARGFECKEAGALPARSSERSPDLPRAPPRVGVL